MNQEQFFTIEKTEPAVGFGRRDRSLDVLRCVACFMVCAFHASWMTMPAMQGVTQPETSAWTWAALYRVLLGAPAPLFVMLSGILFLEPQRDISMSYLWGRKILKLACVYVFWSLLYALYRIFTMDSMPQISLDLILHQWMAQEKHLWFLPMIISMYVIVPILRKITASDNPQVFRYAVLIFTGASILYTIYAWPGFPGGMDYVYPVLEKTPMKMICQYPLWMLYGWILYRYRPGRRFRCLIYAVGVLSVIAGFWIGLHTQTFTVDPDVLPTDRSFCFGSVCWNTAVFCFVTSVFGRRPMNSSGGGFSEFLSRSTLMIYLLHWMLLSLMIRHGFLYDAGLTPAIGVWIYAVIAFCGGTVLAAVIHGMKKILFLF